MISRAVKKDQLICKRINNRKIISMHTLIHNYELELIFYINN